MKRHVVIGYSAIVGGLSGSAIGLIGWMLTQLFPQLDPVSTGSAVVLCSSLGAFWFAVSAPIEPDESDLSGPEEPALTEAE